MKPISVGLFSLSLSVKCSFDLVDALQRHLIRSLCADMCDMIIREIDTSASARTTGQLTIEVRRFVIDEMCSLLV